MTSSTYFWTVVGMGLVTFIPRWVPLFVLTRRPMPRWLTQWLDLIGPAILSALLFPELMTSGEPRQFVPWQPELWVAVPTFFFAVKTRSLGGTVLFGMLLFWGAGQLWN